MIKAKIRKAGYINNHVVLRNIDLLINEGECILITGPSGSGKTTLLLTLVGVINNLFGGFVEGDVSIGGLNPITHSDFVKLPKEIGVVLQEPDKQIAMPTPIEEVLFTMENLGFGKEYSLKKSLEMLKQHGLIDKAWMHIEDLSVGEKRRVTLISSTIHEPKIVLLDEPSASMDPRGLRLIRNFIKDNKERGRTIIIVEHKDELFLDLVDKVYEIEGGTIVRARTGERELTPIFSFEESRNNRRIFGDVIVKTMDLTVGYGELKLVMKINIEVRRGESIAILGFNGVGKSTLLKTLLGFLKPVEGELKVKGKVFYVPQEPDYVFLAKTVRDELKLLERKVKVKKEVIIGENEWLKSILNRSPYTLSHGQKRALSILIALQYKPDLMLLDEPTSGLDDLNVKWFMSNLAELRGRGVSFIIATHDPRILSAVDRVFLIDNGRLREINREEALGWFINNVFH